MPMVGHCYHRTSLAIGRENTAVATCDQEIAEYVASIGGRTVMTSSEHERATSRVAEAVGLLESEQGGRIDTVAMIQGDEPLVDPESLGRVVECMNDPDVQIANLVYSTSDPRVIFDPNNVKVVIDRCRDALYFSRAAIPSAMNSGTSHSALIQTGIIVFRREALFGFAELEETDLERIESIDMNRVLEHGGQIRTVLSDTALIGVDTPEDLSLAERLLMADPVSQSYCTQ
jgi:3-deoxy-manno-octulosonate cytidylyltransferase (CMP-KDO synthetase)